MKKLNLKMLDKLDMRAWALNALVFAVVLAIGMFLSNLTDPLTDELNFAGAFEAVVSPFGGWLNLVLLLGEAAIAIVVVVALYRAFIKENDKHSAVAYTAIVIGGVLLMGLIGLNWVVLPSGAGLLSLIVIIVISGGALMMKTPFKTARVELMRPVESSDELEFPMPVGHIR